jgi:polyisoprenoid-binding protein YceI
MAIRRLLEGGALLAAIVLVLGNARADPIHLDINTQKSQIRASVAEPLARLRDNSQTEGTFHITSGDIDGDPANPAQTGHVKLIIDATSYDSGNSHRDNAVLSSALDTAQYQTISFESIRVENVQIVAPRKMGNADIIGNLTLHGTTREIRVPVSVTMSPEGALTGDGEVTLQYTDFGVGVPRLLFVPAGNEVTVHFHIVAEHPNSPQASK